jgi:hypothetical protein
MIFSRVELVSSVYELGLCVEQATLASYNPLWTTRYKLAELKKTSLAR